MQIDRRQPEPAVLVELRVGGAAVSGGAGGAGRRFGAITEKSGTTVAREVLLCTRVGHHVPH